MRELYSSEPNLVKLVTSVHGRPLNPLADPIATLLTGNDLDNLSEATALTVNEVDNGEFEIPVPQQYLEGKKFGAIDISYELEEYGTFKNYKTYDVSRRLIDFEELNEVLGSGFAIEYPVFTFVETNVRKIIEAYCNQSFNSWRGKQVVEGYDGHILLPENIEQLDKVQVGSSFSSTFLSTIPGYVISPSGTSIFNPERDRTINFFHGKAGTVNYIIEGLWGYSSIPAAVHQAALELAKGFLCDDIEYRRRYIGNIRAGDTRIEFADGAYMDSTGNPIADQMLQPYRIVLMGAV